MEYSDLDPAIHYRRPWNAGKNVGPKRPLKPRDIWAIRFYLDEHKRLRDRALFDLAIDSKLRGCDLVKIRIDYLGHLSTRQYARLVDEWVSTIGLDKREYGTHSMRRTKAALIYKASGNLRAVQILLGHTNIENTVRYLGVDIDDALTLSERTEI
ncbi:MAG: tyrosine-type recombinase/integrase [Sphingobium sp.]|uniref:tyrosine-type recombinase/integrase n=1 Tax=Alphaproteobacteria TaxID=28211 RepID=UPI000C5A09B4|nr:MULTISPECIES: tyrosine-type recombinase/integrase [Alphaproteobacteria]MBU0657508.1 tyrosine-type recombinase/integrase [Alphaproteobacteria bacterium]MBA4753982.1 tyrosine-type recombinase/integrase [Sphingobium sp.]MBS89210.1 integrase [Sphingobium sp.]MBU0867226.1 tyrosine-type recombinase/integrase [Alphaproteobacteria bacterium]MBU1794000.1 tyrosine-type recombinase/integrase [Alphaproteobacteria bacterium]